MGHWDSLAKLVERDDASHERAARQARDQFVDQLYLNGYDHFAGAYPGIGYCIENLCQTKRTHSALGDLTPA